MGMAPLKNSIQQFSYQEYYEGNYTNLFNFILKESVNYQAKCLKDRANYLCYFLKKKIPSSIKEGGN